MKFVLGLADSEKDTPRKVIKCELGVKESMLRGPSF